MPRKATRLPQSLQSTSQTAIFWTGRNIPGTIFRMLFPFPGPRPAYWGIHQPEGGGRAAEALCRTKRCFFKCNVAKIRKSSNYRRIRFL